MEYAEELKIVYPNGRMWVALDNFLPATAPVLRKLAKVMDMAVDGPKGPMDTLLDFLGRKIQETEAAAKAAANRWVSKKTEYREVSDAVREKKKPSGLPIRGDDMKKWKDRKKALDAEWRAAKREFEALKRKHDKLEGNRELLLSLRG